MKETQRYVDGLAAGMIKVRFAFNRWSCCGSAHAITRCICFACGLGDRIRIYVYKYGDFVRSVSSFVSSD
jgi:hypothetical protein